MKTYEELLSDIEDDMELMGALHIVYAMEENGVLTGYDYLPEEPYTISVTLKDLQEKIHQQMLYDKASAYTYDSDKSAPKLAVIFPGVGYTADQTTPVLCKPSCQTLWVSDSRCILWNPP